MQAMTLDEFAAEAPAPEEASFETASFETISFESPAAPAEEDTPTFEEPSFEEPTFEAMSFDAQPVLEGDSFSDVSFDEVDFVPFASEPVASEPDVPGPEASEEASTSQEEATPAFETWEPKDIDVDAPVPFSSSDLLSMPSDSASETATEAPAAAPPPAAPPAAPETSWVARPDRPEAADAADTFGVPQPVVAPMDDFLPSPTARPASVPTPEPPAPEAVEPEPVPAPEAIVVEPTIIEPLGEEPSASSEADPEAADVPDGADDLTVISSIDETTQQLLFTQGVMTLDEIARWGRGEARRISVAVQVSEETIMNQWVFEAQAALFDQFTRQG